MKKTKIFAAILGLLLSVQTVSAQQYVWLLSEKGELSGLNVNNVDYITYALDSDWFSATNTTVAIGQDYFKVKTVVTMSDELKSLADDIEVGVCYSDEKPRPTINDQYMVLGDEIKTYEYTIDDLITGTYYYSRVYVKIGDSVLYGDVYNVKTYGDTPGDRIIDGYDYIDLGLPSGMLWGKCNLGASEPTDIGNYYAWGETQTKENFELSNYSFYSDSKYTAYTTADSEVSLKDDDDAVTKRHSDEDYTCRIPTDEDFTELINSDNTTCTYTTQDDVYGLLVVSKKYNNHIFLPVAGYMDGTSKKDNSVGFYWSKERSTTADDSKAHYLEIGSETNAIKDQQRHYGCSIRGVAKSTTNVQSTER